MPAAPCSVFQVLDSAHPSEFNELVPGLSVRYDKTPRSSSAGHRRSLHGPNMHSTASVTSCRGRMRGVSRRGLVTTVLYPVFFICFQSVLSTHYLQTDELRLPSSLTKAKKTLGAVL